METSTPRPMPAAPSAAGWEADYHRHLQKLTLGRLRITALLVIVIVLLDAVAQAFFDPELFRQMVWVRALAVLLCFAAWHFTRNPAATRLCFPIALFLVCIVSADVEAAIVFTSGYNSPFQTGLALLIVGAGLLVPFPPRQIVLISLLVWVVFLGPLLFAGQRIDSHEPGFTSSTLFMICATLITFSSSLMTSRLRRREFFSRLQLRQEQNRSERLLLNILPAPVAARLKQGEQGISDHFADISVLFADIVGFTPMADDMPPDQLVALLNALFSEFDVLVERHGVEKVKTIGDAYMVVGGAPQAIPGHARRVAELALDMLQAVQDFNRKTGRAMQIRIGMHSGPAVAGVIGLHKFSYDLWGDTVNTASRMEAHGLPGRIHVTDAVRGRLGKDYLFESRGEVRVKGKGALHTWFLAGRRGERGML